MRHLLLLAAAMAAAVSTPDTAGAFFGLGGAGIGVGGLYRSLDFPTERRVPYFAAHPPVYYSQPVPRTYGYSPFAYSPLTRTPDVVPAAAQPVTINNPYVPSANVSGVQSVPPAPRNASPARKARTISTGEQPEQTEPTGPLTIINPYVSQAI